MMNRAIVLFIWGVIAICAFAQDQDKERNEFLSFQISANEKFQRKDFTGSLADIEKCMEMARNAKDSLVKSEYENLSLMASLCYSSLERYDKVIEIYDEVLTSGRLPQEFLNMVKELYPTNALYYSYDLLTAEKKDFLKLYRLLNKALSYVNNDQVKNRLHKQLGRSYYFDGSNKLLERNFSEAESAYEKALEQFKVISDKKEVISVLIQLAGIKKRYGKLNGALLVYDEVVSLSLETKNVLTAVQANKEQMQIYEEEAEMEKSIEASVKINELLEQLDDIESTVTYNHNLAEEAYRKWGNLELAETLFKKNLQLISSLDSVKSTTWKHSTCLKISELMADQQKFKEALYYDSISTVCYLKSFNEKSPLRHLAFDRRAYLYSKIGERDSAFKYVDSLFCDSQNREPESIVVAGKYINRGQVYAQFNEYELAAKDYEHANELLKQSYPHVDTHRLRVIALMGGMLHKQGKNEESKHCYEEYADICKAQYGENSIEYANAIYYLANSKAFCGEVKGGQRDYVESIQIIRNMLREQFCYIPMNRREQYWNNLSDKFLSMAAFALRSEAFQEEFTLHSYNALLLSKGLLLQTEKTMAEMLLEEGKKEDIELYNRMQQVRDRLVELQKGALADSDKIAVLSEELDKLEKQLAQQSSKYTDYSSLVELNYDHIRNVLKEDEIVLDITDFKSNQTSRQYVAFILKKEWKYPLLLPLYKPEEMDSLMHQTNGHIDELYQSPMSAAVLQLVWESVASHISKGITVYYVPSGFMHQIALESLCAANGGLLGSKYHFVRLTSAREICRNKKETKFKPLSAALYGGLEYDMNSAEMLSESMKYELTPLLTMRGGAMKGDSIYRPLQMTEVEVSEIDKILQKKGLLVDLHTNVSGTEESFMALNGKSPHIVHLATHGFYYQADEVEDIAALRGYKDAMWLTGLIMSGGNAGWRGMDLPKGVMDGILTASEISRLNLGGTQLVVLSACETAKGKVTPEGLYGLQRAFKKAGVQTIVMTLWAVSDQVTKEFMVCFYENLVKKKWDKRKAFENAKLQISKQYEEPYYWAGFVMLD